MINVQINTIMSTGGASFSSLAKLDDNLLWINISCIGRTLCKRKQIINDSEQETEKIGCGYHEMAK